ncbi:MAG: nitroreductase family protein [Lachnospiraceae bacterium]|nr:nitroreductase family protein [Lachnospiraceae bacterium]
MKHFIYEKLKGCQNRLVEYKLSVKEFSRSKKLTPDERYTYLSGKILVEAHSLEKGMGVKYVKHGYGKQKAKRLICYLNAFITKKYNLMTFAFLEAVRVIEEYINYQEDNQVDVSDIEASLSLIHKKMSEHHIESVRNLRAGYVTLQGQDLEKAKGVNFEEFLLLRHSIRDYKYELVEPEIIREAIKIANLSPSACNRQPVKVYCTSTLSQAEEVDEMISGTSGFKRMIPNFAIVTVDRAYFVGPEQFQWYINGGIYLSYLSLAFHSLGIGNCIMQWFAFYKNEKKLKKYFGISKSEAIIAVLGFGYYEKEFKCICAQRKSVEDTLVLKK